MEVLKDIYITMFISVLFIATKICKQPGCDSGLTGKLGCVNLSNYYVHIKNNIDLHLLIWKGSYTI